MPQSRNERSSASEQREDYFAQQVMQSALQELSTLLDPQTKPSFGAYLHADTPLLTAAQAVGYVLGVDISRPLSSEDLSRVKDPLAAIAYASGLQVRQVLLVGTWWQKDCGPLLAYLDDRPVALLPAPSGTRYVLYDPIKEVSYPIDESLAATLAPSAYTFYRPLSALKVTALELLRYGLKDAITDIALIVVTGLLVTVFGMFTAVATAVLVNNAIPNADRWLLMQVGLGLLAMTLGACVLQVTQAFALTRIETKLDSSVQAGVWSRLLQLQASFFRQYTPGDLQSRLSAISYIRRILSGTTLSAIVSSLSSTLNLALVSLYSPLIGMLAGCLAVLICAATTIAAVIILRRARPLHQFVGRDFGLTVQLINGVAKLRAAHAETRAFAYWSHRYVRQQRLEMQIRHTTNCLTVFNQVIVPISLFLLFSFALPSLHSGTALSVGAFLAVNVAFGAFITGMTKLSDTIVKMLPIIPFWERFKVILEAQPEVQSDATVDPGRLIGMLTLEQVSFRYRTGGPLILSNVSLYANPGDFIAIIGPSGGGKSTLLKILLGIERPESGKVLYDGSDLATLDVRAVRCQIGVVLQNSSLQAGSIFENIAGSALVSLDEVWDAVEKVGLVDEIAAMPMGINTVISEGGANLSGGQCQRILIARALVLKPRILFFDEATSALDNRTQAIVSSSLETLSVTRVVIAHRLSTIRKAHRIYVVERGQVIQQGTFDELSNQEGLFAKLVARQIA